MVVSASEAMGNLPAQKSGSAEKTFSRSKLSAETPMIWAPAAANLSALSAKAWASASQPPV